MARKKKDDKSPALSNPIPLRLPMTTVASAETAMDKLPGSSQQDILRLASEIGLAALAMVDYDVPGIVAKFALERAEEQRERPSKGKLIQAVPKKFSTESDAAGSSAASG